MGGLVPPVAVETPCNLPCLVADDGNHIYFLLRHRNLWKIDNGLRANFSKFRGKNRSKALIWDQSRHFIFIRFWKNIKAANLKKSMTRAWLHALIILFLQIFCCKKSMVTAGSHAQVDILLQICRHKSMTGEVTYLLTYLITHLLT